MEKARGRQASGEVYYTAVTLLRCADGWEWLGAHHSGDLAGQLEESGINQTVAQAEADDGRQRRSKQALRPTHQRAAPAALHPPPPSTFHFLAPRCVPVFSDCVLVVHVVPSVHFSSRHNPLCMPRTQWSSCLGLQCRCTYPFLE